MELILESYLSSVNDLLSHLTSLAVELNSYESQLAFRLDLNLHKILLISTVCAIIASLQGVAVALFGSFSQNMDAEAWKSISDLRYVAILSAGTAVIVLPLISFFIFVIREGFVFL